MINIPNPIHHWPGDEAIGNMLNNTSNQHAVAVNNPTSMPWWNKSVRNLYGGLQQSFKLPTPNVIGTGDFDWSFDCVFYVGYINFPEAPFISKSDIATPQNWYAGLYGALQSPVFVVGFTDLTTLSVQWPTGFQLSSPVSGMAAYHYLYFGHDAANDLLVISLDGGPKVTATTGGKIPVDDPTVAIQFGRRLLAPSPNFCLTGGLGNISYYNAILSNQEIVNRYRGGALAQWNGTAWS